MFIRWTIATAGILAFSAVAANFYMPWTAQDAPMQQSSALGEGNAGLLTCPADARPAPLNFTMRDVSGKDVTLAHYKGQVILLDFWATWCGPCKIEIPGFVDFQNRFGQDGLQVVGVSVDDTPDQLAPYLKELKMNYPVLLGLGHDDVQDAFGPLVGIPTTFLISRDGKICATHAGFADKQTFEREIRSLL